MTEEIKNINGITFIWVTDGQGWNTAKHNLKETFDVLKHLYCIKDLGNGILETIIK
ncbi:MAG: DpnII family type II restriction endonuclease [Faecalibacillus intestinalis]|uniref:DpnII family type II restriction endonuclease n=1 Tax=Faecalibacillus intestinalis TaxID=1982626 RepID=UPI00399065A1|nr:type II restriction endonuclease [bacterium TM223]